MIAQANGSKMAANHEHESMPPSRSLETAGRSYFFLLSVICLFLSGVDLTGCYYQQSTPFSPSAIRQSIISPLPRNVRFILHVAVVPGVLDDGRMT